MRWVATCMNDRDLCYGSAHDMRKKNKTVFVGLSGGVDSSVAALRLIHDGYDVVGVFIKVWHPDFLACNWEAERLDAMRVAAHLDIPFLTCDAVEAYKQDVAEYFINSYRAGYTPNPDVMCNRAVKFGRFLSFADSHGADYIATGHYVHTQESRMHGEDVGYYALHRGVDTRKDQSYFLWTLDQTQLARTLFPVGDTPKHEIRREADRAGIPVADKKDSQGICFLGHIDIPSFLSHYIDLKEGPVLDTDGSIIGTHAGALVYTIGQRHGFHVTNTDARTHPHYVIARDIDAHTITVDTTQPHLSKRSNIRLIDTNWITYVPQADVRVSAQCRYRQQPFAVTITSIDAQCATITVHGETDMPAPGQSCVLYAGDVCLGGGIIAV